MTAQSAVALQAATELKRWVYRLTMEDFPEDIHTEPEPEVDTLANLGPLAGMAGIRTGTRGLDVNPKPDGPKA